MAQPAMTLDDVIAIRYDGSDIHGLWIGETFVWPDPWIDVWDEGTSIVWDNVWHDAWTEAYTPPIEGT